MADHVLKADMISTPMLLTLMYLLQVLGQAHLFLMNPLLRKVCGVLPPLSKTLSQVY